MGRVIDADEALDVLQEGYDEAYGCREISVWSQAMRKIRELPTIEPKWEWISVKDRLPEPWQEAICFTVANLMDVYGWNGEKWVDSYGYYEDDDIITHWMLLPEPPEKNNEEEQA